MAYISHLQQQQQRLLLLLLQPLLLLQQVLQLLAGGSIILHTCRRRCTAGIIHKKIRREMRSVLWYVGEMESIDNNQMAMLLRRIATFSVNPYAVAYPLQLAGRGLFYDGLDRLVCVYCGLQVPVSCERPLDCHRRLSPGCSADAIDDNAATILRETISRLPIALNFGVRTRQTHLSIAELNVDVRAARPT